MPLVLGRVIKCYECFSSCHVSELVVIKTLNLSASCVVQGAIPGAEGDRRAEAGVVHQILLLLSTNAYKHTGTHIHIQQLQVHFISTSLLLIHICLLPRLKHTHTHTNREPWKQTNTSTDIWAHHQQGHFKHCLKAQPKSASQTHAWPLLRHWPAGSCLYSLECRHMFCFFKGRLPFLMQLLP